MRHWVYMVEHFDNIIYYATAAPAMTQWLRVLAPVLVAGLASAAVALIVVREQVTDIKAQVSKGILPLTEERMRTMQLEILQMQHQHEAMSTRLYEIEQNGPTYCLRCHMRQGLNHPKVKG